MTSSYAAGMHPPLKWETDKSLKTGDYLHFNIILKKSEWLIEFHFNYGLVYAFVTSDLLIPQLRKILIEL